MKWEVHRADLRASKDPDCLASLLLYLNSTSFPILALFSPITNNILHDGVGRRCIPQVLSCRQQNPLQLIIIIGTSLMVQWVRLCAPNAGVPGSIPGQGTRSHMPQLRARTPQLRSKLLYGTTKTRSLTGGHYARNTALNDQVLTSRADLAGSEHGGLLWPPSCYCSWRSPLH